MDGCGWMVMGVYADEGELPVLGARAVRVRGDVKGWKYNTL